LEENQCEPGLDKKFLDSTPKTQAMRETNVGLH
jgi:hypothetical protein